MRRRIELWFPFLGGRLGGREACAVSARCSSGRARTPVTSRRQACTRFETELASPAAMTDDRSAASSDDWRSNARTPISSTAPSVPSGTDLTGTMRGRL